MLFDSRITLDVNVYLWTPISQNKFVNIGKLTLIDFKTYNKGIEIKTVQYWHKGKHLDQWNVIET